MIDDANARIRYSFNRGSVIAQSVIGMVNAGGIVGERNNGQVHNSAALGGRVIAATPTRNAGRIAGLGASGTLLNHNYAINSMRVGMGVYVAMEDFLTAPMQSIIDRLNIAGIIPTTNLGLTAINGEAVTVHDIRNMNWFWLERLGLNLDANNNIVNLWDFNGLAGRGFPLLLLPDGRLMAGQ